MATIMVSFRCPVDIKSELAAASDKLSIDQSVIINQGIRNRLDEISSGIIEGPTIRTRKHRQLRPKKT